MRNITVREARAMYESACRDFGRYSREARAAKKVLQRALDRRDGLR